MYLILTADYEIFGNGTGDARACIIHPTQRLLDICNRFGVKVTIFFEVCEYWAFKEAFEKGLLNWMDYNPSGEMEKQIQEAVRCGHDVQLHLHPQWLNWKLKGKKWILDMSKWRISALDEEMLESIFIKGKSTLESLLKPVNPSYECVAFRAGALCIQPEEKVLKMMEKLGFLADSTVMPGFFMDKWPTYYDFKVCPNKPYWKISTSVTEEDPEGPLWELPIRTKFLYPWQKDIIGKLRKLFKKSSPMLGSCEGYSIVQSDKNKVWLRLIPRYCSLDVNASEQLIKLIVKSSIRDAEKYKYRVYPIVMTGHPKFFTDLSGFKAFLAKSQDWIENGKLSFCTLRELIEILKYIS